ncbi:hypothetical protein [Actinomadura madurae]|uniref:hypothetical protein n=2 Tax=Actinomadura madurae TaxID=1993 RepID=UPI002025B75B|nr:hypothetical protein [Actinomadura madurae]MCP9968439.1 hypothetical protein [Actinomadura madurae]MCP9980911.1 hypothetical protein [Actinomadura madurae]URN08031.1 hypothetical protein LUW74_34815 [Actinomadura madurae]
MFSHVSLAVERAERDLGAFAISCNRSTSEAIMALALIGRDPDSGHGNSPTVVVDTDLAELVVQGWTADTDTIAEIGRIAAPVPGHETAMRLPERMEPILRRALERLEELRGETARTDR